VHLRAKTLLSKQFLSEFVINLLMLRGTQMMNLLLLAWQV